MPLRINYESGEFEWVEQETQDLVDRWMAALWPKQYEAGTGKAILIGTSMGGDESFRHLWEESKDIVPIIPKKRKAGPVDYFRPAWDLNKTIYLGKEMYDEVEANKDHPLHIFLRKPPLPPDWPPTRSMEEKMKAILNEIYNRRKA